MPKGDFRRDKRFPVKETVKRYRQVVSRGLRMLLHRERAEKALGKPLPEGVQVHHADGSKRDDAPLVICQDAAYHKLLHRRARIVAAGGNPDTEKICSRCREVKPRSNFARDRVQADGLFSYCRPCLAAWQRSRAVGVSFGMVR